MDKGFGVVWEVSAFDLDDAKYLAAVVSSPLTAAGALASGQQEGGRAVAQEDDLRCLLPRGARSRLLDPSPVVRC